MPRFFYIAKSFEDKVIKGNLNAKDIKELSQILKSRGFFLVNATARDKRKSIFGHISLFSKVSIQEKIIFIRNLSVMMATGLSLVKIFDILAAQARSKRLKNVLLDIKEKVNKGEALSSAMADYPDIFSDFFTSMIRVGEESGTLEEVLKGLAANLEKEHKLRSQIRGAMIYPIILLSLMIVVGVILSTFVLPKLKQFFSELQTDVPFYTKMIFSKSDFLTAQWLWLIIILVCAVLLITLILKTKTGKWLRDTILLRLPFFSSLVKKSNCCIFIRSLASLLNAGVSITRSLEILHGTLNNFYFKKAIMGALEGVKRGENLSSSLFLYKDIFPYGAIEMIEVGEETGKTPSVLKTLADFYEEEVADMASKLSSIIEPILIILMGAGVGIFAISIIGPIYSSLSALGAE